MAEAPGFPGTSFTCRSCGVMGSQSSFWSMANAPAARQNMSTQRRNQRISSPQKGEYGGHTQSGEYFGSQIYTPKPGTLPEKQLIGAGAFRSFLSLSSVHENVLIGHSQFFLPPPTALRRRTGVC